MYKYFLEQLSGLIIMREVFDKTLGRRRQEVLMHLMTQLLLGEGVQDMQLHAKSAAFGGGFWSS